MNARPRARARPDLAVAAIVGGVAFVALVGGIDGSPLHPVLPFGAKPLLPFRIAARATGLDALQPLAQAAVAIAAVALATGAFLYALREAWRGHVSVRLVVWLGLVFVAIAVALPLLLSRDVYSYSMYGRIHSLHHANPYVSTPAGFSGDPMYRLVGEQWRDTTAVYGPAFTLLSAGLTGWLHGPVALIWAYKVIAGLAAGSSILLVARLSRRLWPERAAFATALVAWNPVLLFHGVGGGHNDLLVELSVIGALSLIAVPRADAARSDGRAAAWRELAATAVLTIGTLVKATAVIPLVLAIVAAIWRRPARERVRTAAAHLGVVAAVGAAFAAPLFQTSDPTFGLATLATHEGWLAPSRFFRVLLGDLGHVIAGGIGRSVAEMVVRVVFPVAFAVAFAVIVRMVVRRAPKLGAADQGAAWGWALLAATLAAPVLLPWYVVWTLPVVWLLPRIPRSVAILVSAVLTVSQTVAAAVRFPTIFHGTLFTGHYFLTPVLFVAFVVLLRELWRRYSDGSGLGVEWATSPPEHHEIAASGHRG
ncbi:MAG: hypothetical protein ABR600_01180 [Actinomycetota bacterium]